MASIIRRAVDGKPRYDVKYREPDGRQRKKTFTKRVDADRFAATVEADKIKGAYIDPDAGRITFRRYVEDDWLPGQRFDHGTRESVDVRLRLHVLPILGSKPLAQIKATTLRSWYAGLEIEAPTYRIAVFSVVSAALSAAVEDERIVRSPARSESVQRLVRGDREKVRNREKVVPWTDQQVGNMRDAITEKYRIAVALGVGLGLRQGEIFGLSPDDVDFLRGKVTVRRQVKILAGNRIYFGLPKREKVREVPLPDAVRDELAAHLARFPARDVTLPWRSLDGEARTVPLILSTREGGAMNRNYFNTYVWKAALAKAGIDTTRTNGCHAMRHHYASVLLDAGESIKAVSEYLGHADPGFTLRTYTHLLPTSHDRTQQAVNDRFVRYIPGTSVAPDRGFVAADVQ